MSQEKVKLSAIIAAEFKEKRELSDLNMRKVLNFLKDGQEKNPDLRDCLMTFTQIALTAESEFKDKKNKKSAMECFCTVCGSKQVLTVLKQQPQVMDKLFDCLMDEKEEFSITLTKIIQDFMLHNFKSQSPQKGDQFNQMFKKFYQILEEKSKLFNSITTKEWAEKASLGRDAKQNKIKDVTMRYSIIYYADIMTHIMMLIDEKLLMGNDELIKKVQGLLKELLTGFTSIDLYSLSKSMERIYFDDLIYVINKSLTLISRLISKNKNIRQSMNNPQVQIMSALSSYIEKTSNRGSLLIKVVIDLLKVSDVGTAKQKFDCFLNIRSYVSLYPKFIIENLKDILEDSFFKQRRNDWSVSEVNNVYYCWIYAQKSIIKTEIKPADSNKSRSLIEYMQPELITKLLENLIGIIFDRRTFPNFVVNALNHLKNLVDILNRSTSSGLVKSHRNLLQKILQKLVIQMKIIRNNHMEIIQFLDNQGGSETIKNSKHVEMAMFDDLPRYENFETEEEFQAASIKYFENENLDLENIFFCNSNQRTYISPLLEDEEGLVINSIVISPNSKKLSLFIDENILMRIGLLNEISNKILKEILFRLFTEARKQQGHNNHFIKNSNTHFQDLGDIENYLLNKVFKYNLEIYYQLTIKSALTSFKELNDPLRFNINFVEIKISSLKVMLRLDSRQLYYMIENNIVIILKILKNLVKLGADTYPQYFQQFFDIFSGTNSHKPEDSSGIYMYTLFCEILIKNLMNLIDRLPETLDKFHFLYDEDLNIHVFILKVLKYIFRTIRLKESSNPGYATSLIIKLRQQIFKLILIIIKLTSEQMYPIDYLFLMKIIFKTIVRCDNFYTFFTTEIIGKGIRVLEFFIMLFKTGIEELKILSTELTLFIPLEIKHFLVKYPEFAKDFIPMITYALTLQESFVILRAIQTLDHIINSSSMLKVEVLHLLEPHAPDLFKNLNELMIYHKKRDYFFKPSTNLEPSIIPATLKILAKLSPFIRQLDIKIKFSTNKLYQMNLMKDYEIASAIKALDKVQNQENLKEEDLLEQIKNTDMGLEDDEKVKELFTIRVTDFDYGNDTLHSTNLSQNSESRKKSFKFDTTSTLLAVFKTVDKLAKKPELYYYFSISPNLLYVSTLKHRLGIQKIHLFLSQILDSLCFQKNHDIRDFIIEEQISLAENMDGKMENEKNGEYSFSHNLKNINVILLKFIEKRSKANFFLIQKVIECNLQVLNFLHPFKNEQDSHEELEHLKNLMFTLIKKAFENSDILTTINEDLPLREKFQIANQIPNFDIKCNLMSIIWMFVHSLKHQLTLSREIPEDKHFKICVSVIQTFVQYSKTKDIRFYNYFKHYLFHKMIKQLYSSDFKVGIGAIYFLKELFKDVDYKAFIVKYASSLLNSIFVFLNKLPPQFNFEIQTTSIDLCRNIVKSFIQSHKSKENFKDYLQELVQNLIPLIETNTNNQQKLLTTILNIIFNKLDERQLYKLLLLEEYNEDKSISLDEILEDASQAEKGSPFYKVVNYVIRTIEGYVYLIKNRSQLPGAFRQLSHEQSSKLSNMILVLTQFFKLKIKLKIFDGNKFENKIETILKGLLVIIKENEEFNEKKMELRGSSVRINSLDQTQHDQALGSRQTPFQPYRVNTNIYYQDIENDIHIDDHDFYIKSWSKLIENIVLFFANFLTQKKVHSKIKQSQVQFRKNMDLKKQNNTNNDPYPNEILRLRDKIIIKLFDLLPRVEKRIRQSVNMGFKYLLSFEQQIKEIMHEDKLVSCFRPLLTCLQLQDLQNINQNTLYSFRKLFKLFHSCFNKSKLYDKLIEYLNHFKETLKNDTRNITYSHFQLINSIFILFTKMVSNNELNSIMKIGLDIEKYLQVRKVYNFSLKPVLMKVINQQSSSKVINFLKENIMKTPSTCYDFLLETLKQDQSHPFRERVSREELSIFLNYKGLESSGSVSKVENNERIYRWTKLVRILSRKIPAWLVMKKSIIKFYGERLKTMLEIAKQQPDLDKLSEPRLKDHFITTLKIIVEYCSNEKTNTDYIFILLEVISMKINNDFGFIYKFFKETVPQNYLIRSQKDIFLLFIKKLEFEGKDERTAQDRLRLANHVIVLPILHNFFKQGKDQEILTKDVVNELREKIKHLHINTASPAWVLVEMTLMLDYIVAKTDNDMKNLPQHINEFLEDVLIFAWRNIGSPRENNKLLRNMSKLLVSRLIARFNKLKTKKVSFIYQLFRSVVCDLEDIHNDETKHIWIKICHILMPEIKKCNMEFKENENKKEGYWLKVFIQGIEGANSIFSQFSKEIPNLYNRYWNSIILNREIIEPHKEVLMEGQKFYSVLNSFISSEKQPTILLDILLIFIHWYTKDMLEARKKDIEAARANPSKNLAISTLNGDQPETKATHLDILGLSYPKKEYLINMLIELVKRDENSCGMFLNRSYYLLRKYLLAFPKATYNIDSFLQLLKTRIPGYPNPSNEEMITSYKRLRMNFVVMNISLALLYHPIPPEKKQDLISKIYNYIFSELLQKDSKNYTKFPYLIPLAYEIIKRIILINSPSQREKFLQQICKKAGESVRYTVKNYKEKGSNPNGNLVSLWVAILLFKLVYEMKPNILAEYVHALFDLIKIFIEYLVKKGTREEEKNIHFDPNEDILDKFFKCENIDPYPEIHSSPRNYYKGYSILILRILVYHINSVAKNWKNKSVIPIFSLILQKVGYYDYDIKMEALMLLKCLVLPECVTSPVYKKLTDKIDNFTIETRIKIFLRLDPESFLTCKETENKGYKLFVNMYWDLLIDFLDNFKSTHLINESLRRIILINNSGVEIENKDRLFNKINSFAQNGIYSKFLLLINPEMTQTPIYYSARQHQMIKKLCLLTTAEFSQKGKLESQITKNIQSSLDQLFEEEEDYILTEKRKEELTKEVNVCTRKGKVIKTKQALIFEDLNEEIKWRITNYKNYLKTRSAKTFFNSYRDIIDLNYFSENRTTQTFWISYVKQLWNQCTKPEKDKLWLYLNDLAHFNGNSEEDYLISLLTLKELRYPFMMTEQMKILCKKVMNPLVPLHFIDELREDFGLNVLSSNPRKIADKLKKQNDISHYSIAQDTIFYNLLQSFQNLGEKDMCFGMMNTYFNSQSYKKQIALQKELFKRENPDLDPEAQPEILINIDQIDKSKQQLVHNVQNRMWLEAEALSERLIKEMEYQDPESTDFETYFDKYIIEECWVEVQKNLNEWQKLHELSTQTERRDVLLESAYFLHKPKLIEKIAQTSSESDNPLSYVYFMSIRLMDTQYLNEVVDKAINKQFKEIIYISLINEWYVLPKVFSEKHKAQLSLSHFCLEFEEGWDLIQLLRRHGDIKELPKIKDEILYLNLICRERIPHNSMGILNCKKIFEQRSLISHVLNNRMAELVTQKQSVLGIKSEDLKKLNIFNETYHNAIRYCETERKFGVFNTIFNIAKQIEENNLSDVFSSQNDEFLYLKEKLKLWAADGESFEINQSIENRLNDNNFNKDLRSDLRSKIMFGYLQKNMLKKANENGVEALKLNQENWKAWKVWFHFYRRMCDQAQNFTQFLNYLNEMIICFRKLYKIRAHKSMLLFSEIIKFIMERKEISALKSKEKMESTINEMNKVVYEVNVWVWVTWLPSLLLQFYPKRSNVELGNFAMDAFMIASKVYPEFTQRILTIFNKFPLDEEKYKKTANFLRNSNLNNSKYHETFLNAMTTIWDDMDIEEANDNVDLFDSLYEQKTIDNATVNDIYSRCSTLKRRNLSMAQFKNQDASHKFKLLLKAFEDYIQEMKILKRGSISDKVDIDALPLWTTIALPNESCYYKEKFVRHCMKVYYLVPDIDVIFSGRRFKLLVEFSSMSYKNVKYTFEKRLTDDLGHFLKSHYQKMMNIQLLKDSEAVYRDLKFLPDEVVYFEEEFIMRKQNKSESFLVDILDNESEAQGISRNYPLELLADKTTPGKINKILREKIPGNMLEKEVLKRLNNRYDLFYWRKRYSQNLGIHACNDLIFCNDTDFENLKICFNEGNLINESVNLKIEKIEEFLKNPEDKSLRTPIFPLRMTKSNLQLMKDYMIEGVVAPTISSICTALNKINQNFDFSTLMNLFTRDYLSYKHLRLEDDEKMNKLVEGFIENYFLRILKMGTNYLPEQGEDQEEPEMLNDGFDSLRGFLDQMMDEDFQNELSISLRSYSQFN